MTTRASSTVPGPILIVSAFAPELAPLRATLARSKFSSAAVACVAAGIGAVDAAVGAAVAISVHKPRLVIFIGTAGSYGARPQLGAVAVARRIVLASSAVARGDGYLPGAVTTAVTANRPLHRRLLRAAHGADAAEASACGPADVACPLAITSSAALARRLSQLTGAGGVENLEAFAVARAATRAGIPFGAVLGISNRVGPRAHAEWLRHQKSATAAAAEVVSFFLRAAIGSRQAVTG